MSDNDIYYGNDNIFFYEYEFGGEQLKAIKMLDF